MACCKWLDCVRYNKNMGTVGRMQWSRLKKMLESRFCCAFVGHVHIYMARYTNDEEEGRMWIVLDKQQVFSAGDCLSPSHPTWYCKNGCVYFNASWGRSELEMFLLPYLSLSIEEALVSSQEIIRALAMFDKRLGKRRLKVLADQMENEALLVKHFYEIRCHAEKLKCAGKQSIG